MTLEELKQIKRTIEKLVWGEGLADYHTSLEILAREIVQEEDGVR